MFPKNADLLLLYIYFNYSKRFNLNSVKTNLIQLKKIECGIKEKYIIFCLEQKIKNIKNNGFNLNNENAQDNDSQLDLLEQKYQKLKYLIENSIKLYGEFWGIFSTNISSNINTYKLYILGERLNIYLNEMNSLWEQELKNTRISNEYQNIVQLYSKFLLDVLWDQKKSKEVYKKLNDDNLNNYHLNDNKKFNEENKNSNKIEALLDNQDYLLFGDSDEKGNCKIIQSSASFSHFLSYQKIDIIGKPLEIIFPNILMEEHCKFLAESIKMIHIGENNQTDLSLSENDSNKNAKLLILKSKMGYIFPLYASFTFLDDNDYSDSFLVKIKMENKEPKSEYAYFVLTNTDFTIENISSSAINLGLSLDLLKKYVVKMDILVRENNNKYINLFERYNEFEDEPKRVTWIFPDIIYPKYNIQQNKEEDIEELIEKSSKKDFNLQIKAINFNDSQNLAILFKFTEINLKKNKLVFKEELFIPKCNKNLFIFYLNNLSYRRIYVVDKKTGLRNLKNEEQEKDNNIEENINKSEHKNIKRRKRNIYLSEGDSSDDSEKNKTNILTKEKILELQALNHPDIKNFIVSLPIYGSDVALEKFRPNGDKYSASKITEPLIKIQLSQFCKRMEERFHIEQNSKKKKHKSINEYFNNDSESSQSSNTDNYLFSSNSSSIHESSHHTSNIEREDLNKGLSSDLSTSLSNLFKSNTIKYIRILINITFLFIIALICLDFFISFGHMNKLKTKINYLQNGYIILANMLYTKHFITEGVISNELSNKFDFVNRDNYLNVISKELSLNRQEFTEMYDTFTSNDLCKEFQNFMQNTKIIIYTLTVNKKDRLPILFNSAMSRISSSMNNLVTNPLLMVMENRDTYELMYNLINEYYMKWEKVVQILLNDSKKATELKTPLMIILLCYLIILIIFLFVFLKLLARFSLDREKPINLFLTLKKVVFENLKNSAENFSNKLLNKFFGNEDNEEDSQLDYQSNIQPNDINIVKFKAAIEYNSSINNAFNFMTIIVIIIIFLLLNLNYFIIKYFEFRTKMDNISQFIILFDKTNVAKCDFILSEEIFKSYLFNKEIPILGYNDTKKEFIDTFINLTDKFEDSIIYTSKTKSFLSGDYLEKYEQYYLGDYSELLDKEFMAINGENLKRVVNYGLKPIQIKVFEIIRYFTTMNYFEEMSKENNEMSSIYYNTEQQLFELNILSEGINRKWYEGVLKLMINSLHVYQDETNVKFIIFFICSMIFAILYYSIIWRIYEEKLNNILKGSVDLINLIPQEIKNIIIEKLNE